MVGKTNVGGGGGSGSNFLAYIQVTTDANAQISAVNPHGDTFVGTANSSGSLILTVTAPGTFTVSETDGGTATVDVINYGVAYSVSVFAFTGYFITDGLFTASMDASALGWASGGIVAAPTIQTNVTFINDWGNYYTGVELTITKNYQGVLITSSKIDVTDYDSLVIKTHQSEGIFYTALFDTITDSTAHTVVMSSETRNRADLTTSLDISSYSGEYYVGVCALGIYDDSVLYIKDLYVE